MRGGACVQRSSVVDLFPEQLLEEVMVAYHRAVRAVVHDREHAGDFY